MKHLLFLIILLTSCNSKIKEENNDDCINSETVTIKYSKLNFNDDNEYKKSIKENIIIAKIDSVSLNQIKHYTNPKQSIFEYYNTETLDEVEIWSDKMFGRCCTEADLLYSELLDFDISTNIKNDNYPDSNLSDKTYGTAYVFKENDNVEITLRLLRNSDNHVYYTNKSVDDVLKTKDTILKPFRLSLVNGYVKSEDVFYKNGRVKEMKILLNNKYKNTIMLQDIPLIQEFNANFPFFKNDIIKLVPISYYEGSKYNDVCISEIQSSLAHITYPNLNKRYVLRELQNSNH